MPQKLYLIPCNLSDSPLRTVIPDTVLKEIIPAITIFIVENVRTARRFLKKVDKTIDIDGLLFYEIGKRSDEESMVAFFSQHITKSDIGLLSEAGCPGVADPGAKVTALAHQKGVKVVPLVGPSSILLALMASGMNGQNFTFHGYLPVKPHERKQLIKQLELRSKKENQTQIFIETPYRNMKMWESLLQVCNDNTLLCVASHITAVDEYIATKTVARWKKEKPDLGKRPSLFLLYVS